MIAVNAETVYPDKHKHCMWVLAVECQFQQLHSVIYRIHDLDIAPIRAG